jgi:hypothetical protein
VKRQLAVGFPSDSNLKADTTQSIEDYNLTVLNQLANKKTKPKNKSKQNSIATETFTKPTELTTSTTTNNVTIVNIVNYTSNSTTSVFDQSKKIEQLKSCLRDETLKLEKKTTRINTDNNKTLVVEPPPPLTLQPPRDAPKAEPVKPVDNSKKEDGGKVKQMIDAFEYKLTNTPGNKSLSVVKATTVRSVRFYF